MPNTSAKKKVPWIPPPARTRHQNKTSNKSTKKDACLMHTNEEDGFSRNKVSNELPDLNLNSKKDEDKAPAGHSDIHTLVCGISSTSDQKIWKEIF
ncbi:hypothetical protein CEXT_287511 [Caerostris extrusa]|uniref:Uncharacterized protein n=1 Tax=Caerostris extrusa TaxID=172846 RepID=A0AAV4RUW1_CAEEX|nr:hypothetical protein CEXT_287511 [Caerostris extrusa]